MGRWAALMPQGLLEFCRTPRQSNPQKGQATCPAGVGTIRIPARRGQANAHERPGKMPAKNAPRTGHGDANDHRVAERAGLGRQKAGCKWRESRRAKQHALPAALSETRANAASVNDRCGHGSNNPATPCPIWFAPGVPWASSKAGIGHMGHSPTSLILPCSRSQLCAITMRSA